MMKITLLIAAIAVAFVAFNNPVYGQADAECKWCVTPTKCDSVDESAAAGCTEWAGGECVNHGICVIVEATDDQDASLQQFMWTELVEETGIVKVNIETTLLGSLPFVSLGDGLLGTFNCEGTLAMVATPQPGGGFRVGNPEGAMSSLHVSELWRRAGGMAAALIPY